MIEPDLSIIEAVYKLFASQPRFDCRFTRHQLPTNGIYVFYEAGEVVTIGGQMVDRIVRVGTHRGENRLPHRLRTHFTGKRRRSVFRRHLGGALLARDRPAEPQLATSWADREIPLPDVEEMVSQLLRDRFTFRCLKVDYVAERFELERGLIALLSLHPLGQPSERWLGRHAVNVAIRQSGLWNTLGTNAEPLTSEQFNRLRIRNLERKQAPER